MNFEDNRNLGIQLGCIVKTDTTQYLVLKNNENYSSFNIGTVECSNFEVSLDNIKEMIQIDFKETIQDIIPSENINIVAQNKI